MLNFFGSERLDMFRDASIVNVWTSVCLSEFVVVFCIWCEYVSCGISLGYSQGGVANRIIYLSVRCNSLFGKMLLVQHNQKLPFLGSGS